MIRIKRYVVPALTVSIALMGVAWAQPAGAATRSPAGTGPGNCSRAPGGGAGGLSLQGTAPWNTVLTGCFDNGKIYLWNDSKNAAADVFIVRDSQQELTYTVSTPGLSAEPAEAQAADEAVAGSKSGTYPSNVGGVFSPDQMVTITSAASGQPLSKETVAGLNVYHDRIATDADGSAQVIVKIAKAAAKAIAGTAASRREATKVAKEAYDCVEGIREVLDKALAPQSSSTPAAWPQTSQEWMTFLKAYAWTAYKDLLAATKSFREGQACGDVYNFLTTTDEEPSQNFINDLLGNGFDAIIDILLALA
jgi:hypothetical protein